MWFPKHRKHHDLVFLPGAYAARGMILSQRPNPDYEAAEQDYQRGLKMAESQGAAGTARALASLLGQLRKQQAEATG